MVTNNSSHHAADNQVWSASGTRRFLAGATGVMLTGLLLASCSTTTEEPAEDSSAAVASADNAEEGTGGSPQPTTGGHNNSPNKLVGNGRHSEDASDGGACRTRQLKIDTAGMQGSAGSKLFNIVFTNTSHNPCSLNGFPGVSLVTDNNGTQLGKSAVREDVSFEPVMLDPGGAAIAPVKLTSTGPLDPNECEPTRADGLRVYPPGETKAAFIPMSNVQGCRGDVNVLSVQPVTLAPHE
ncbi:DUF4232 domain-containing protein [Corynebacterium anserum]|nr:DUF4232 domain-containing protein [Corynebacterium anserum]MBC2681941.1 DUF4232 domain-containing protein [Corynebacterium anserum]